CRGAAARGRDRDARERAGSSGGRMSAAPKKPARRSDEVLRAFHEEADIVKAYDARLLARLWPFVRPHAKELYFSLFLLLITAGLSLVRPLIIRSIIDSGSIAKDVGRMMLGRYILLGVVVVVQTVTLFN